MDCTHHWKIASPNGRTAIGVCKRCGEERVFPTSSDTDVWYGEEGRERRTQASAARTAEATAVNEIAR